MNVEKALTLVELNSINSLSELDNDSSPSHVRQLV